MPNTKKTKTAALPGDVIVNVKPTKAAIINSSLKIPLKGTKVEVLKELSLITGIQIAFILQAIEDGTASKENKALEMAISTYYECQTLQYYILNDISF